MSPSPRILIVGGVAGGASAAARARRLSEEAEIVLFERGPYVSFANCGLPYHIGGTIEERGRLLVQTPESLGARFELDVRVHTEVVSIDTRAQVVGQAAVGEGDVGAALQQDDFGLLRQAPGAGGGRGAAGDASDDDDAHGCSLG